MRKHTQLQSFAFIIIMLSFASCQDDDEGVLFPNGSRELVIEFDEPFPGSEKFCFVTSADGQIWWDTIYSANQSVKQVAVPFNQEANITVGTRHIGSTNFGLITYRNVVEDFLVSNTVDLRCVAAPPAFGGTRTHVVINGVNAAIDLVQVGISKFSDQMYLSNERSFHFNCRPLTYGPDTAKAYFFASQETLSDDVKGVSISWSKLFKNDTLILDYDEFELVNKHVIEIPHTGFWEFAAQGSLDQSIYFLKSKQFAPLVIGPSSNNIVLYVPKDIDFDEYSLNIYEPISIVQDVGGLIYHGVEIPQSISLFTQELVNIGTSSNRLDYKLTTPSTLIQSRIRYQNLASWSVVQLGGQEIDFTLPNLPSIISDAYPILGQSFAAAKTLEVTSFQMNLGTNILINKKNLESIIDCQGHQYISLWEELN